MPARELRSRTRRLPFGEESMTRDSVESTILACLESRQIALATRRACQKQRPYLKRRCLRGAAAFLRSTTAWVGCSATCLYRHSLDHERYTLMAGRMRSSSERDLLRVSASDKVCGAEDPAVKSGSLRRRQPGAVPPSVYPPPTARGRRCTFIGTTLSVGLSIRATSVASFRRAAVFSAR